MGRLFGESRFTEAVLEFLEKRMLGKSRKGSLFEARR